MANPAIELAKLIASFKDADGRVNIPGFYDRVKELTAEEVKMMRSLPYSEAEFLKDVGSPKLHREGYDALAMPLVAPTRT